MANPGEQAPPRVVAESAAGPQTSALETPASGDGGLFLDPPAGAVRSVHPVQPEQVIGANFPSTAADASLRGADLVLDFGNGGAIVLQGYWDALRDGKPPSLVFQDGILYEPPRQAAQAAADPANSDLNVASGPGAQTIEPGSALSGGGHAYQDGFGDPGSGLRISGTLPPPGLVAAGGRSAAGPDNGARTTPSIPAPTAADLAVLGPQTGSAQTQPVSAPNRPPSALQLTGGAVDELPLTGLPVGIVSVSDPDPGDSHTFALTNDAGGRFAIGAASGLIVTALALDFETAPSHAITVRVTDSAGAAISRTFSITVNDLSEVAGGAGADVLSGTAAMDVIDGMGGDDQINAGGGDDIVFGGIGRDVLNGEGGDDILFGEAENDTLDGGPGADRLFGGSGNDVLRIDAQDTLIDGGSGIDRVEVQGAAGVTLNLTASGIELAFGGAGADTFDATGSNVGIRQDGAGGDDILIGGNLGDRLRGEAGNDSLFGNAGDDLLDGGLGDDSMTGGPGADVFAVNLTFAGGQFTAGGNDTVTDLSAADVLSFRGVVDANGDTNVDLADLNGHVAVATAGAVTTLTFDGGGSVALQNLGGGPFNSVNDLLAAGLTLEAIP